MWWSKTLLLPICIAATNAVAAAQVRCPASILDAGVRHALNNAVLYDGTPDKVVSLVPVPVGGNAGQWDTGGIDPYLVCQYKGTTKTVMLHANAVKFCTAGRNPFRAYCK